jgi:hypothetical protein
MAIAVALQGEREQIDQERTYLAAAESRFVPRSPRPFEKPEEIARMAATAISRRKRSSSS